MKPFAMALPESVEQAVAACGSSFEQAKPMAGGTDLLGEIKERLETPELVVNLKHVPGLDRLARTERGFEVGALVSLAQLAAHEEVLAGWPAIATTVEKTATPALRNVGTVGGNLCQRVRCWYYRHPEYPCLKKGGQICYTQQGENEIHAVFDNRVCCAPHPSNLAPVLVAYGAHIEIASRSGRRTLPVEEFFVRPILEVRRENILKPGEVVTGIILPAGSESKNSAYVEAREKRSFDWALASSTVVLHMSGRTVKEARVVLGAVAPTPLRRKDLEKLLAGAEVDDELMQNLRRAAIRGARTLRDNGYKLTLIQTTLERALRRALEG